MSMSQNTPVGVLRGLEMKCKSVLGVTAVGNPFFFLDKPTWDQLRG